MTMEAITKEQLDAIAKTARLLLSQIEALSTPPELSSQIQALVAGRIAKRICLACGNVIAEGDRIKRGLDTTCYNTTRNRIRRGEVAERTLVEQGKLAIEGKSPGRIAKQDQKVQALVDDAEAELKQRRAAKKKP